MAALWTVLLVVASCYASVPEFDPATEKLVFFDDFTSFNTRVWKHELTMGGGGNWEFEWYVNNRTVSFAQNSVLYIQPQLTASTIGETNVQSGYTADIWGNEPADVCTGNAFYGCSRTSGAGGNILNPVQSARVRTAESFSFKYGRVEVVAKLPRGDWLWPAIWLLPADNQYGQWPASGEIDIMESRGNDASYPAGGVNQFGSTLHFGPTYPYDGYIKAHQTYTLPSGDFSQNFHTFGLYWDQYGLYTYIDNVNNVVLNATVPPDFWTRGGFSSNLNNPWVGAGKDAPFDQEFFLIFNLAVGGTNDYFPDGMGNKPWQNTASNAVNEFYQAKNQWLPTWQGNGSLQIDKVSVWQSTQNPDSTFTSSKTPTSVADKRA